MTTPLDNEKLQRIAAWEYLANPREIRAMAAELVELRAQVKLISEDAGKRIGPLMLEVARLQAAVTAAANELGVPQPGYPAPVANAARILREALGRKT